MSVYCKSEPYCASKYDCEHCSRNENGYRDDHFKMDPQYAGWFGECKTCEWYEDRPNNGHCWRCEYREPSSGWTPKEDKEET